MRYVTVAVFKFDELSDKAKATAIEEYRQERFVDQNPWAEENAKSIRKICEAIDAYEYDIDSINYVEISTNLSEEVMELTGIRAYKYIWNNFIEPNLTGKFYAKGKSTRHSKVQMEYSCAFTGYHADMLLWDAWKEYSKKFNKNSDIYDFYAIVENVIKDFLDKEDEYYYSDECIIDEIDARELEFTEEGFIYERKESY